MSYLTDDPIDAAYRNNWAYIDNNHISYYMSGWMPQRARGTSPDFPILGTGQYDWNGFNPQLHTASWLPFAAHPHATDQDYLVSWNNKQAPRWAAADDRYAYGPIYRSQMIASYVKRDIAHGRKMNIAQLVQSMEEPATTDIRPFALDRILMRALGRPSDKSLQGAMGLLRSWASHSGHRRDLDGDGRYDDDAAVTLMAAWWPRLVDAEFGPPLGSDAYARPRTMISDGAPPVGRDPAAPDFADGYWGFVSKDLRDLYDHRRPRGRWSRVYCGAGSRTRCRSLLRASLRQALTDSRTKLYGHGDCASNAQASCFDQNRFTVASAIDVPNFPFQNRPTFQQTVELTRHVPR